MGVGKLLLEGTDAIRRTGQSDDTKSAARETPDNRRAGAGTDAGTMAIGLSVTTLPRHRLMPAKAGLRLSMKARTASLWSVVRADRTMFSAS